MRRKQNFEIVFGLKSDTAVLTFSFSFLSSPPPSLSFSPSLAEYLVELVSEKKVFNKQDEILSTFRFMQNTSETSLSKTHKIGIFAKGLVHGFGQKFEIL